MSVVAFERKPITGVWSESELNTIVAALSAALAPATGRQWETGTTENGDAQFYTRTGEITTDYNFAQLSIAEFGSTELKYGNIKTPEVAGERGQMIEKSA